MPKRAQALASRSRQSLVWRSHTLSELACAFISASVLPSKKFHRLLYSRTCSWQNQKKSSSTSGALGARNLPASSQPSWSQIRTEVSDAPDIPRRPRGFFFFADLIDISKPNGSDLLITCPFRLGGVSVDQTD